MKRGQQSELSVCSRSCRTHHPNICQLAMIRTDNTGLRFAIGMSRSRQVGLGVNGIRSDRDGGAGENRSRDNK